MKYGWRRQLPDHRDHLYTVDATSLPSSVDLRPGCPPVVDQGQLGSCTANAIAGALGFDMLAQNETFDPRSRLFIYYCERAMEGTVKQDAGAVIRDGIKAVNTYGAPPETLWPYNIARFARKPSRKAYTAARAFTSVKYSAPAQNLDALRAALAAGRPIVFGFTVYESFESQAVASTGQVPMPSPSERVLGGHAVLAVGYDDARGCFLVRNSWGTGWGLAGHCWMPYGYLTNPNLASDFWVIESVV